MSKKTIKKDPFAEREAAKYERPIPSREFILAHLKHRGKPAMFDELILELELKDDEAFEALHRRLKAMVRDQELERMRSGYFWPTGNRILIKGRVQAEKGKGKKTWVIPDDGSARILLSHRDMTAVYQGNHVVVSVIDLELPEKQHREGNLIEILEQDRLVVTGRFVQEQGIACVIPHGKEFTQDILIPPGKEKGAKDGYIVVVEIIRTPGRWSESIGEVLEVLGHENTAGIEIQATTRAYGLPEEWPSIVLKEIQGLTAEVPEQAKQHRLDLRHLPLVTIDGEDARDFDDAVFCEPTNSGGWRLYVAIADVSHYVKPNSALDVHAKERGNSVYFPGKVIPMLPEVLSNGLCSLNPEVDRLCLVCILNITNSGRLSRYEFHEAVMRSAARLTYTKVAALLSGKTEVLEKPYQFVIPHLQELYRLYQALRVEREERGAIEFETIETRVIFGKNGKISQIIPVHRNEAHRIIEECMLCANVATARFLKKNKLPGLYRIHEGPAEDKLADLRTFLGELGLSLGGGKTPKPLDYARLLRSIQDRTDANIIQTVLLRSLSQAVYSPDNLGHFGLAYPAYTHFTSPIRRYPDLLVHRQIRTVLRGEWTAKEQKHSESEEAQEALIALGNHTSMTERRADEATRDALRWLKCEYMLKHIGDVFDGVISGVTRFGFFVELKEIYIDGLVHVITLRNDYYFFDASHHRLVGERSGIIFRLGDSVKVRVTKVDPDQRKIDFELMEMQGGTKKQRQKQGAEQRRRKEGRKEHRKEHWKEPRQGKRNVQRKGQGKEQNNQQNNEQSKEQSKKQGKRKGNEQGKRQDNEQSKGHSKEQQGKGYSQGQGKGHSQGQGKGYSQDAQPKSDKSQKKATPQNLNKGDESGQEPKRKRRHRKKKRKSM